MGELQLLLLLLMLIALPLKSTQLLSFLLPSSSSLTSSNYRLCPQTPLYRLTACPPQIWVQQMQPLACPEQSGLQQMQSPAIPLQSSQPPQPYLLPPLGHHHKLMMTLMTSLLLLVTLLLLDQLLSYHSSCHSICHQLLPLTSWQHCLLQQMPQALEFSHRSSLTL